MQIELVLAITGLITAILAGLGVILNNIKAAKLADRVSKRSDELSENVAKKDEVQLLRDEVARLQIRIIALETENTDWREKYSVLYEESLTYLHKIAVLEQVLVQHNIPVPKLSERVSIHRAKNPLGD